MYLNNNKHYFKFEFLFYNDSTNKDDQFLEAGSLKE